MLETHFKLSEHGTTIRTEIVAGLTTFLTMAYILLVNPDILSASGMDKGSVFVATIVAAAVGSLIMGLYANYPIALAPGLGLNAFFSFTVVQELGHPWQVALGAVFLSGIIFLALSVLPVREWVINAIPKSLKMAITAGIGFFIFFIALQFSEITVPGGGLVRLGDVTSGPVILVAIGFITIVGLDALKVPGAIVLGILGTTALSIIFGISEFQGIVSLPPNPAPTFLQLDIIGALDVTLYSVIFAFLFVDLFDTAGTLVGVSHRAGLLDEDGKLPRLGKALTADSGATIVGSLFGTSTTTSYIESAAGVRAGGRTGLTAVVVAILFLLALFFAPLANTIPRFATAPALLFIGVVMAKSLIEVDWEDVTEYIPAVITALVMPFTFSIAHGIAIGFIVYAGIKLVSRRFEDLTPAVIILAVLFLARYAFLPT